MTTRMVGIGLAAVAAMAMTGCDTTTSTRVLEADDPALAPVAWLTGAWVSKPGEGPRTEEHWIAPSGGTMFGVNRTVADGRTIFFEYLRIERTDDGGLVYLASPKGRNPPTAFQLVEASIGRLVFENPEHDYPQRLIYSREADGSLLQRIEGEEDGAYRESEWCLVRARVRRRR